MAVLDQQPHASVQVRRQPRLRRERLDRGHFHAGEILAMPGVEPERLVRNVQRVQQREPGLREQRGGGLQAVSRFGREVGADQHAPIRSEEHPSELQSLMRISYAAFCLKKTKINITITNKLTL